MFEEEESDDQRFWKECHMTGKRMVIGNIHRLAGHAETIFEGGIVIIVLGVEERKKENKVKNI